jgi:multidrug efflux pump
MNDPGKTYKEFGLSSLAVKNGTSVLLIAVMILLFGIISYKEMPKEQFPEASLPTIFVNTPYFGNSAEEIENLLTRPLEKEIESITGIKTVNSTSIQDFSVIIAEFDADLDMETVLRRVKDAVDKAKKELPSDLTDDPSVEEINLSEIPIVSVNISGAYSNDELKAFADHIKDQIENIKEISGVNVKGLLEREMKVDVDLLKMQSLRVSFDDIANAISSENLTMSAGEIVASEFRRSVRVVGQFKDAEELGNIIIKAEKQRPIVLKEIADVSFGFKERMSIARSDQLPVVSLDVIKRRGENLLNAADQISVIVENARETFPQDLNISLFNDQSVNTRNEVSNLENSIISGVILVILVLMFFLGLRNASFVGIAIPLSMLMGIMFLYLSGSTMNMVVLFSLILALGMLVDNAIVVVENIYRFKQNGFRNEEAARYGAGEVAIPIIASTATTLAAFVPLAFWPGVMGEFMKYLPLTLILVLSASLFVALVINPVLTARFMKIDKKIDDKLEYKRRRKRLLATLLIISIFMVLFHFTGIIWMRNLLMFAVLISLLNFFILRPLAFKFQDLLLPKIEAIYDKFIRISLHKWNPIFIFIGTFFLLIFAIILLGIRSPEVKLFPDADPMYINVFVDLPLGSDITATDRIVKELEQDINKVLESRQRVIEAVLVQIGEDTNDPNSPPEPGVTPHKARISISFIPTEDRQGVSTSEIMNDIRKNIRRFPGVEIVVDQNAAGPPAGKPINLEIRTENIDSLLVITQKVRAFMDALNIPGIEELKSDLNIGKPEMTVQINREAARRYELSTYSIGNSIRTSIFGNEVSKFKQGEDDYPIILRAKEGTRENMVDIMNQKVTFRNPANGQIVQVPISAVADVSFTSTYNSIKRKNGQRVATLYSNVLKGYNANTIVQQLKRELESYDWPEGVTYEFTGEQEQQAENTAFLSMAFLIAVFSIFIIIVSQFNSIISPFIIILSVLFSTIGVFLGYVITGSDISLILTGVGLISLAGIVVNNAIVLIDYVNLVIRRKLEEVGKNDIREMDYHDVKESIIEGGATRLRPVLLTAITTILGLIPLAIGFNFNFFTLISDLDPRFYIGGDNTAFWGPLAWTVIYGLTFATFLTLIVVPVMYWLAIKGRRGTRQILKKFIF